MNKKLFVIIVLFSLSLLAPYKAYALDKNSTEKDILEDIVDKSTKNFILLKDKGSNYYIFYNLSPVKGYSFYVNDNNLGLFDSNGSSSRLNCYSIRDTNFTWNNVIYTMLSLSIYDIKYSSFDILNKDGSIYFKKNYTSDSNPGEIVEPGEPSDTTSCEFPFTREEFMTIPYLIALLICMLFFKWCFPMKGGKKA